jgi:hypothetical protein
LSGEFSAFCKSRDGLRDICRLALAERPEQEGLDRGTSEDGGGLPLAVRQRSVDRADVDQEVRSERRVGYKAEFRCGGPERLVSAFRERVAYLGYWIHLSAAGHESEVVSAVRDADPRCKFLADVGCGADEGCVSGCVHNEEFAGDLIYEVNEAGELSRLGPLQIVEIAGGGPDAVYERNDLAGDDTWHWTPLKGSSTRLVSARLGPVFVFEVQAEQGEEKG